MYLRKLKTKKMYAECILFLNCKNVNGKTEFWKISCNYILIAPSERKRLHDFRLSLGSVVKITNEEVRGEG